MCLFCAVVLSAQTRDFSRVERVYLTTDRDYYIAGEPVWISAFNFDPDAAAGLSDLSCIAYVELHSASGQMNTTKIALEGGRGCGRMMLPSNLPTGNYTLIAYTAQNVNEKGYDYGMNARTISVFNTFSSARVENGVSVVDDDKYVYDFKSDAGNRLSVESPQTVSPGTELPLVFGNSGNKACDFSVSIYHENGITHPGSNDITDVRLDRPQGFSVVRTPEYEGEIVRARVVGSQAASAFGKTAYIASPSEKASFYMAEIAPDGQVAFYTNNIFGDKDIILEIDQPDDVDASLELITPFVTPSLQAPARLQLCRSMKDRLLSMSASMQISRKFDADTLYELLPVREDPLFKRATIKYHLDDYRRFTTIEEDVVEFITQMRVRRDGEGHRVFDVRLENSLGEGYYDTGKSLVMIDGVPVLNHESVFAFNPLLVEDVNIYTKTFLMGTDFISGYADFVTYKKDMGAFTFPANVKMFSFKGASQPLAYTCANVSSNGRYPDYRQTIYWHPAVRLAAGEKSEIRCCIPDYEGRFLIKMEGVSEDGTPFVQTLHLDVKR